MPANIIGAFETVAFPEFATSHVTAKIDTGAYTGALHCSSIVERDVEGGKVLAFEPLGSQKIVQKDDFVVKYVRSSNGKRQKRYFIATHIIINEKKYDITLSLANRSEMKWPVLIGRRFLQKNNFLVDPAHSNRYREQADKEIQA
jgi:hypothetical protein